MLKILKIGDFIKDGNYRVHSRFKHHVNLVSDDNLITITDKVDDIGPLNIIIENADLLKIIAIRIQNNNIWINKNKLEISADMIYNSLLNEQILDLDKIILNINSVKQELLNSSKTGLQFLFDMKSLSPSAFTFLDEMRSQLNKGLELILNGELLTGILKIKGRGVGLTPEGDDFIAGLLYGLFIVGKFLKTDLKSIRNEIYTLTVSSNLISTNFLYLACEGRFYQDFKTLISALSSGNSIKINQSIDHIISRGETSGADLLTGFTLTIQNYEDILAQIIYPIKRGAYGK